MKNQNILNKLTLTILTTWTVVGGGVSVLNNTNVQNSNSNNLQIKNNNIQSKTIDTSGLKNTPEIVNSTTSVKVESNSENGYFYLIDQQ